jgi:hypothetical protein
MLGDQFGFRRGKGTRVAIGMLRIISTNFVHGQVDVCVLLRLAGGMNLCKLDQINANPKGKWYQLMQKNIGQQIVQGSEC